MPFRSGVRMLCLLPLAIPPFLGALAFRNLLGDGGVLTRVLELAGLGSPFESHSALAAGIVQTFLFFPLVTLTTTAALERVDPSLGEAAEVLGFTVHVSTPGGYEVDPVVAGVRDASCFKVFNHPLQACAGAHLVTTDVWTSMGYEAENEERRKAFVDWCVDEEMMAAARPDALFMHCLPAHRGEEVTTEVIDGPQSVVWDEAENRMHVQKALMEYLLLGRIG